MSTSESGISTTFDIWSFIKIEENEEASLYHVVDKIIKMVLKIFETTKIIELEGRLVFNLNLVTYQENYTIRFTFL